VRWRDRSFKAAPAGRDLAEVDFCRIQVGVTPFFIRISLSCGNLWIISRCYSFKRMGKLFSNIHRSRIGLSREAGESHLVIDALHFEESGKSLREGPGFLVASIREPMGAGTLVRCR